VVDDGVNLNPAFTTLATAAPNTVFRGAVVIPGTTVTTPTSTAITATTATLGGDVTSSAGTSITACGVVYSSTNTNPTIGGSGVTNATTTGTNGVFTVNVSSLTPGSTYYFAAYATNSGGTSYSPVSTFTALPQLGTTSLVEGPGMGTDSDILADAGSWTVSVSPSDTWLHLSSAASGSGNTLVTFSFDANAGATRTGTITIAGQTLTVMQHGTPAFSNLSAPTITYGTARPPSPATWGPVPRSRPAA
jgi:hypothetical protein